MPYRHAPGNLHEMILQGFPGRVDASVKYTLTPYNEVVIEFEATSDAPTPINMAQHSYFNLDAPGTNKTVLDHLVFINGCGANSEIMQAHKAQCMCTKT